MADKILVPNGHLIIGIYHNDSYVGNEDHLYKYSFKIHYPGPSCCDVYCEADSYKDLMEHGLYYQLRDPDCSQLEEDVHTMLNKDYYITKPKGPYLQLNIVNIYNNRPY